MFGTMYEIERDALNFIRQIYYMCMLHIVYLLYSVYILCQHRIILYKLKWLCEWISNQLGATRYLCIMCRLLSGNVNVKKIHQKWQKNEKKKTCVSIYFSHWFCTTDLFFFSSEYHSIHILKCSILHNKNWK